jgi:hypothetical protein
MLSDRFGLRRLVPASACLVALGLVLASQAQTLWMFYVACGVIFAMGYCGLGELSHVPLSSRWFVRKRGTAIGIAMAGMDLAFCSSSPWRRRAFSTSVGAGHRASLQPLW